VFGNKPIKKPIAMQKSVTATKVVTRLVLPGSVQCHDQHRHDQGNATHNRHCEAMKEIRLVVQSLPVVLPEHVINL
jgi:hypothetical protein